MADSTPTLITTAEVAEIVARDRSTITRWVQSGRLNPVHRTPGGMLLFASADVERLAAELATEPQDAA